MEEKTHICIKCGKEKKESEGRFYIEGNTYCCKDCCGDQKKGEHRKKKDNICEFC